MTKAYNQRPKTWWQTWRLRFWVVLVVVAAGAVLYSPVFAIKNIIVDNAPSHQTELRIMAIAKKLIGEPKVSPLPQWNLLFFSTTDARKAIDAEFYINGLEFERQWPNVLRIVAPQDTVVARWQADANQYLVSGQGTLVQQVGAEVTPGNLLLVKELKPVEHKLGDQVAPPATMKFVRELGTNWQAALPSTALSYVSYDSEALPTLQAYTNIGWYVLFSAEQDLGTQLTAVRRLLEEKIQNDQGKLEYLDVRFGSRLYYKLR